jgi:hypothetical protein
MVHQTDTLKRVCSLQDFAKRNLTIQNDECQVVYTFVFGGNSKGRSVKFNESYPVTIEPANNSSTRDAIYLNVAENHDLNWKKLTRPNLCKVLAWYNYATNVLDGQFDYVAYLNAKFVLLPTVVWPEELFSDNYTRESIYGGLASNESQASNRDFFTQYVLLSMKLVRYIANQTLPPVLLDEAPGKAIADMLVSYHEPVTTIPFKGIVKPKPSDKLNDFLGKWDFYKDSLLNYEDREEVALVEASPAKVGVGRPRLLVGIFTTDSLKEKRRRDLIRTTYLRFYVNTTTPKLICALLRTRRTAR